MSQNTSIEWTGATWNPIRARLKEFIERPDPADSHPLATIRVKPWGYHCEHVSPGCTNCYAEAMNKRLLPAWGTGLAFNVPNQSRVEIFLDEKELVKPLGWKKPQKIFPCSMTDLFADFVPDEMIDRMFAVMALCPQHIFQVLTKRAERMRQWFAGDGRPRWEDHVYNRAYAMSASKGGCMASGWPLRNVHLGVSVEDQQRADERIPHLLQTPAAVRWVSYEPALGPVDWTDIRYTDEDCYCSWNTLAGIHRVLNSDSMDAVASASLGDDVPTLDWGVYGGESGHAARPNDIAWARSFIRQFHAARIPAFVKQLGRYPVGGLRGDAIGVHPTSNSAPSTARAWERGDYGVRLKLKNRKGGDMAEWPEDVRVREMPEARL